MINLNKYLPAALCLLSLMMPVATMAAPQLSLSEAKAKIKEIKLDEGFLFGEGFSEKAAEADREALQELTTMVNTLRSENKSSGTIDSDELKKLASRIECLDDDIYEVCYYISVEKALGKTGVSQSNPQLAPQTTTPPQAPPKEKDPVNNPPVESNPVPDNVNLYVMPAEELNDMIEAILAQDTWYEIRTILSHHKGLGRLKDSGSSTSLGTVPADATILLFDDQGGMIGFLSPKNGNGQRTNYKTNALTSDYEINDYKFIFWYK